VDDEVPVFDSQIGDNIQIQVREGWDQCSSPSGELSDSMVLIGQKFEAEEAQTAARVRWEKCAGANRAGDLAQLSVCAFSRSTELGSNAGHRQMEAVKP
jgi:hypothetical protein